MDDKNFLKNIRLKFIFIIFLVLTFIVFSSVSLFYYRSEIDLIYDNELTALRLTYKAKIDFQNCQIAANNIYFAETTDDINTYITKLMANKAILERRLIMIKTDVIIENSVIYIDDILVEINKWEEIVINTNSIGDEQAQIINLKINDLMDNAKDFTKSRIKTLYAKSLFLFMIALSLGIVFLTLLIVLLKKIIKRIKIYTNAIRLSQEELDRIIKSVGDGIIVVDLDKRVTIINMAAQELTGWSQEEAKGKNIYEVFNLSHENSKKEILNPVDEVIKTNTRHELANNAIITTKDGKVLNIEDSAAPVTDVNGKTIGVVLIFRDVTEKKAQREQIRYLSFHDQMTGLYNRRCFEEELSIMDNEEFYPLSIIIGDLNNLKMTNDAFGHLVGDELLIAASKCIKDNCRKSDVIARWGGDEFVILLPNTDESIAGYIVEKINKSLCNYQVNEGMLSMAFGWDTKYSNNQDTLEVFKKAEDYMYSRKLNNSSSIRRKLINGMMKALFEKSPQEEEHSSRVRDYSEKIATKLNINEREKSVVNTAALLHDIGKLIIDDKVLNKTDKLTKNEWDGIKRHTEIGYRILSSSSDMLEIATGVLGHHERWDGTGYPKGSKEYEIPLSSRIIAIADAYDAMISERPYRKPLKKQEAIKEIIDNSGSQFDPEVAKAFLEIIENE